MVSSLFEDGIVGSNGEFSRDSSPGNCPVVEVFIVVYVILFCVTAIGLNEIGGLLGVEC